MGKSLFVSYARADAARVTQECDVLSAAGFAPWRDERIDAGSDWRDELAAAIERSDALVYFVSPASVQSDVCIQEIDFAQLRNKPLYPVYLEATELPTRLEFRLAGRQAIFAHELESNAYRAKLIDALHGRGGTDAARGETTRTPRIAVIPFHNIGPNTDYGWLGRKLSMSISGLLHRTGHFDVVPERDLRRFENSSASVHDIRRAIGIDYLLEGATQVVDEHLSLDVTLIDARVSGQLWARTFVSRLSSVISMETDLIRLVVGALEVEASADDINRGTTNSEAYLAHLQGVPVASDDADTLLASIDTLKRAVRLDPTFGQAFVALASAYYFAARRLNRAELMKLAFENYRRALEVGGLTLGMEAWTAWTVHIPEIAGVFEWDRAEAALRSVMSQRDAYDRWCTGHPIEGVRQPLERGYALILSAAGLFDEAAAYADIELDRIRAYYPNDWDVQGIAQQGVPLYFANAGQWDKAGAYLDQDLRHRPEQVETLVRRAEWCLIPAGRLDAARADLERFTASEKAMQKLLGKGASIDDARKAIAGRSASARIRLAIAEGDTATARRLIERHDRGDLLALLGDIDGMVGYFEHHMNMCQFARSRLIGAPHADVLSQHPRYRALLERTNLTDAWQRELSRRVELLAPITGVRPTTLHH